MLLKHMSLGSFWGGCSFCGLSSLCFPAVNPAGQVTGQEFLHQLETIFPPTSLLLIGTGILYSMLCWASVSRCSLGKCQTLTYHQSSCEC